MTNHINTLNPPRAIYSVLGNLCKNPRLLRDSATDLKESDFAQNFHKIVFSSIYNLAFSDSEISSINEIDIDNYLASYPKLYKEWDKHDGLTYVRDSIEHSNEDTFKTNYNRLKKFSLLRHYVEEGIDVSDLIDYKSLDLIDQEKGMKTIDGMEINDIIEHYSMKIINIKDNFNTGQDSKDFKVGDGLDSLLDKLNEEPEFGYPFQNGFYNTLFRGMRRHKFMLRSADTGGGKTRLALADICNVACSEIYDIYTDRWVDNGPVYSSLFISTEVEKIELQTTMLAFVTGINGTVIEDGRYSEKIYERLKYGIEVLKRAPIYCVYVDDFSISDIEMIIEKYIIEHGVSEVAFDYIQMTPKLSKTMNQSFGSNLREDQILVQFSSALKILANKYNIYLTSSTQLNRNSSEAENRNPKSLRGGSSIADKADYGVMTFPATKNDHRELKHILEKGFHDKPNYSHWVYKNRGGISDCIIWTYIDLGNMREKCLFVTDNDFNLMNVDQTTINFEDIHFKPEDETYETVEEEISEESIDLNNLGF